MIKMPVNWMNTINGIIEIVDDTGDALDQTQSAELCRLVNIHSQLVEALEAILEIAQRHSSDKPAIVLHAEQALAAAKAGG
jgi:hypothetical protein